MTTGILAATPSSNFVFLTQLNQGFCIQAPAASVNAIVTLQSYTGPGSLNTWIQPILGGPIYLAATYNSSQPLVLDVTLPNNAPNNGPAFVSGNGAILFLNTVVSNSMTQQWSVNGISPVNIINTGLSQSLNQTYMVDAASGGAQNFNAVELWVKANNTEQQWVQAAA